MKKYKPGERYNKMMKKRKSMAAYEGSALDRKLDRITGFKEGSKKDESMDRLIAKSLKKKRPSEKGESKKHEAGESKSFEAKEKRAKKMCKTHKKVMCKRCK